VISQIDAPSLADAIRGGRSLALLDVREPWEYQTASIAGSVNIPMSEIPRRIDDVKALQSSQPERELVLVCHHGTRSMYVAQYLAQQGLDDLINLRGGIDAWSQTVDPTVPRY
jgi:rhodanese-related sulfurtransferase